MKILIAEDDFTSRLMLQEIFVNWGYKVILAEDGEQAWQILKKTDAPRIAVLDWVMPGMDGLEVCKRVKAIEDKEPVYIILLSGRSSRADIVKGFEAGADDYMTKPFDENELKARIRVAQRMIGIQAMLTEKVEKLQEALDEIKTLKGFIPICASCKQIRDDQGYWNRLESYIQKHSEAVFTHSICPDCITKLYPDLDLNTPGDNH